MSSGAIEANGERIMRVLPLVNKGARRVDERRFADVMARVNEVVYVEPIISVQAATNDPHEHHRLTRFLEHACSDGIKRLCLIYSGDGGVGSIVEQYLLRSPQSNGQGNEHLIFGHIPGGAFNVYARERGIPLDAQKIIEAIGSGTVVRQDYLRGRMYHEAGMEEHIALLAFGFGDGAFVQSFEEIRRRGKRSLMSTMVLSLVEGMKRYTPTHVTVNVDGGVIYEHKHVAMAEAIVGPRYLHLKPTKGVALAVVPMEGDGKLTAFARTVMGFYLAHAGWQNNPFFQQVSGDTFTVICNPDVAWHMDAEPGKFPVQFAEITHQSGVPFLVNGQTAR